MAAEGDRQREGTAQPRQHGLDCLLGARPTLDLARDQMRDHFGIGLTGEAATRGAQLLAQFLEVLDNAVVDQRDMLSGVRMRVVLGRRAVRSPAGVRDADCAGRGAAAKFLDQIGELALRAAAHQIALVDRAEPGAVVAAIFHPPEPIDQPVRDRILAHDADNTAHNGVPPSIPNYDAQPL